MPVEKNTLVDIACEVGDKTSKRLNLPNDGENVGDQLREVTFDALAHSVGECAQAVIDLVLTLLDEHPEVDRQSIEAIQDRAARLESGLRYTTFLLGSDAPDDLSGLTS